MVLQKILNVSLLVVECAFYMAVGYSIMFAIANYFPFLLR